MSEGVQLQGAAAGCLFGVREGCYRQFPGGGGPPLVSSAALMQPAAEDIAAQGAEYAGAGECVENNEQHRAEDQAEHAH